jgi:hypothetical protein
MAIRTNIKRGEDFEFEYTFRANEIPDGESPGDWTQEVRFGELGASAQFIATPTQDPDNELRFTGTLSADDTAAISDNNIVISVVRTDLGSVTYFGTRLVPVVGEVLP